MIQAQKPFAQPRLPGLIPNIGFGNIEFRFRRMNQVSAHVGRAVHAGTEGVSHFSAQPGKVEYRLYDWRQAVLEDDQGSEHAFVWPRNT